MFYQKLLKDLKLFYVAKIGRFLSKPKKCIIDTYGALLIFMTLK